MPRGRALLSCWLLQDVGTWPLGGRRWRKPLNISKLFVVILNPLFNHSKVIACPFSMGASFYLFLPFHSAFWALAPAHSKASRSGLLGSANWLTHITWKRWGWHSRLDLTNMQKTRVPTPNWWIYPVAEHVRSNFQIGCLITQVHVCQCRNKPH